MNRLRIGLALGVTCLLSALGAASIDRPAATAETPKAASEADSLRAELAALKELLPDQTHAMSDVAFQFGNLWFAGQAGNWPLADFFLGETRSHLRWAVHIKPIRKDKANRDVNLSSILQAMENGPLKQLADAVAAKDLDRFSAAYRFTLENCYACHKASEKPYLRPTVPHAAPANVINFDPNAQWPQ